MVEITAEQADLAKLVAITGQSFAQVGKHNIRGSDKQFAFGKQGSALYVYIRDVTIPAFKKSVASFANPKRNKVRSHWIPLEDAYDPYRYIQRNSKLVTVRQLTQEEYRYQAMPPARAPSSRSVSPVPAAGGAERIYRDPSASGASVGAASGTSDAALEVALQQLHQDNVGHVYIQGTIADTIKSLPPDVLDAMCQKAYTLDFGINAALRDLMVIDAASVRIGSNTENTTAVALTFFDVEINQRPLYRLAYGGPGDQYFFVQVPSITEAATRGAPQVVATLQSKTTGIQEKDIVDGYGRVIRKLTIEVTRVSYSSF
jgi:hypothetical protein